MSKAVLVDITKCIGCGSCTVACKLWNDLEFRADSPAHGADPKWDDSNWTTVTYNKVEKDGQQVWRYAKEQCLHCEDPACASVCFAKAIVKTEEGPVVYDPEQCVGCRYCMIACPFEVPKYQWDRALPSVSKCQMCATKIVKGEKPACVSVCPTNVMTFGEREEILALAKKQVASGKYVNHIYGEKEAGGTSWIYISDVPFDKLGFKTNVTTSKLPHATHGFIKWTPSIMFGGGALFTALSMYTKRRIKVEKEKS